MDSYAAAVFNQVLVLLLIIIVGFYARRKGMVNNIVSKKLSEILLKITTPFLIVASFQFDFSREMLRNVLLIFIFAVSAHIFSILLGKLLYSRYPGELRKIMKFSAVYSNCGYMGFPVLRSLFGQTGVLYSSVYVAVFNMFLWTHGVIVFSGEKNSKDIKKVLLNPGIVSVVIGMLLFVFSIKLPEPILQTLDTVGSMTTPLSMILVGAALADVDFKSLFSGFPLYYATAIRLILIPLIGLTVLKLIGFPETLSGTCVILLAMPVAAATTLFSEMYDSDTGFASRLVAFSTILSLLTIPLIVMLI